MVKRNRPGAETIYRASELWVDQCLRHRGSLFEGPDPTWTTDVVDELARRCVGDRTLVGRPADQRLSAQLAGAPSAVVQLAAELRFVQLLIVAEASPGRKRTLVESLLAGLDPPTTVPPEVDTALDHGLLRPGAFYMVRRDVGFMFLARFAQEWCWLGPNDSAWRLDDPWAFREFVWSLPVGTAAGQRNALLHVVHPGTFEPIVSDHHKQLIAAELGTPAGSSGNVDQQIGSIRTRLSEGRPTGDFYDPDLVERWGPTV